MPYLIGIVFLIYVAVTLRFAFRLNDSKVFFGRKLLLVHHVLIWLIPFVWIVIVKSSINPGDDTPKEKRWPLGGLTKKFRR